jgi:hypothetical protein
VAVPKKAVVFHRVEQHHACSASGNISMPAARFSMQTQNSNARNTCKTCPVSHLQCVAWQRLNMPAASSSMPRLYNATHATTAKCHTCSVLQRPYRAPSTLQNAVATMPQVPHLQCVAWQRLNMPAASSSGRWGDVNDSSAAVVGPPGRPVMTAATHGAHGAHMLGEPAVR